MVLAKYVFNIFKEIISAINSYDNIIINNDYIANYVKYNCNLIT